MRLSELKKELLERTEGTDARIIIHLSTGLDAIQQIVQYDKEVSPEEQAMAYSLLERRLSGTPMAYITGEKEFYGHAFMVTKDVLIPRPDTETLVETALELSKRFGNPRILDLCTGSGAIAASISYALSQPVSMSDISPKALSVAEGNYLRITGRAPSSRLGSLLDPWKGSEFDIIATNPPYLTDIWYEETEIDVKAEPKLAFIGGGDDGLDIIRTIIADAPSVLAPDGFLTIECDYRQTGICGSLLESSGFSDIHTVKDLAGKERVVYGRRLP